MAVCTEIAPGRLILYGNPGMQRWPGLCLCALGLCFGMLGILCLPGPRSAAWPVFMLPAIAVCAGAFLLLKRRVVIIDRPQQTLTVRSGLLGITRVQRYDLGDVREIHLRDGASEGVSQYVVSLGSIDCYVSFSYRKSRAQADCYADYLGVPLHDACARDGRA